MGDVPQVKSASSVTLAPHTHYVQSIEGCLEAAIGNHGLAPSLLSQCLERIAAGVERLKQQYETGELPLLRIAEDNADIDAAQSALEKLSAGANRIVFFGTGGSGLGGQTLAQIAGWNIPGGSKVYARNRPRTRFYDNLDALTLSGALDTDDLENTRFVVTSKSGGTTETLAQALTALSAVKAAGLADKIPNMFLGISEPANTGASNGLRQLFAEHRIAMLDHHTGIGGRFSCLTNVGLLPALARGLDAKAIRRGAGDVVNAMLSASSPADVPAAVGAAVALALSQHKGIRNIVMMPYSDRLARFSHWFVQLWAESLGKDGKGTTPIATLGPLDQHSQMQLFLDGPREHYITVLRVANTATGPNIDPQLAELANVEYMSGKTIGDIVEAQADAVVQALIDSGRPVRTIDMPSLDEAHVGAILMHFMLETILAGYALDLDPFDQPAVELAKIHTRRTLADN